MGQVGIGFNLYKLTLVYHNKLSPFSIFFALPFRENDDIAHKISQQSQQFVNEYLTPDKILCYQVTLLKVNIFNKTAVFFFLLLATTLN